MSTDQVTLPESERVRLHASQVRVIRRLLRLRGPELARVLCVSTATIYRWEREGCVGPSRIVLLLLAAQPELLNEVGGRWHRSMAEEVASA